MKRYPSAAAVAKLNKQGRWAVGDNVYLQVSEWGTKAWIFRYERDGRARHMGLGPYSLLTLAKARARGREQRRLLLDGVDPLEAKRAAKRQRLLATIRHRTFEQVARDYIAAHEDGWRGDASRKQWIASLETHAFPKIGDMPIANIDVAAVLLVLEPIARAIPETAHRIRNRIAAVLDWAAARELRQHDNPAKRPNLLSKRKKLVRHFAALPYSDIAAFMVKLRQQPGVGARALEFLILTACRPGEVLGARWDEISGNVWTIPANRMKGGREHRIPLSDRAFELLAHVPRESEYVFAGNRTGAKSYTMALVHPLRRMDYAVVPHGFRSSFRDWAAETTAYPNHVVEMALAHAIGNGVEAAYRRGDLFEKRRRLMQDWADYCSRPTQRGASGHGGRKTS
jgi:integrase